MHNRLAVLFVAAVLTVFGAGSATAASIDTADPNSITIVYGVNTSGIVEQVPLALIPNIGDANGVTGSAAYTTFLQAIVVDGVPTVGPVPVVVNIGVKKGTQVIGWDTTGNVYFPARG